MRILWQTEHYPDARKGGGSVTNTRYISRELARLGHDVTILARGRDDTTLERELIDGTSVLRLGVRRPERLWPVWPLVEPLALRRALARLPGDWDAFVCHDPAYALALRARHRARPVVMRVGGAGRIHDACVPRPAAARARRWRERRHTLLTGLAARQEDWIDRRGWSRADAVIVQSWFMQRDLAALYRLPSAALHVVPSGVDHERFGRAAADVPPRAGRPWGARCAIAFCGRLVRMKNVAFLLRAFAAMRSRAQCELLIAGDGEERRTLELEAARLRVDGAVRFLGHVESVEAVLAASDVFVLPSLYEPFANAVLEAMAAGLPCLALRPDAATVRTSGAEVIDDGETGFLVDPADPRQLAARLDFLVEHPAERASMGARARARCATRYTWAACAAAYARILDEAAGARAGRPERAG